MRWAVSQSPFDQVLWCSLFMKNNSRFELLVWVSWACHSLWISCIFYDHFEFFLELCSSKIMNLENNEIWLSWIINSSNVENILKSSLDLIPSPSTSVKIHIKSRKVCLRFKDKTLLGIANKLLKTRSLFTSPSNVLPKYIK